MGDQNEEEQMLLVNEEREPEKEEEGGMFGGIVSRDNFLLGLYVVLVVLTGTGNRVAFKLMQYSIINYTYFASQLVPFTYIPVNGAVLLFKMKFTNDITPEMRQFPKRKFLVMGTLDSLAGLIITVGGRHVPGIMQNLLLQGVVVVTMVCSLLLLRNSSPCEDCVAMRESLQRHNLKFTEEYSGTSCSDQCCCQIFVDNVKWDSLKGENMVDSITNYVDSRSIQTNIVLVTSAKPWKEHLKTYYSIPQYIGAAIILGGLVFSVWPALQGDTCGESNPAGPPGADLIFFSSTIPIALSAVYKEIAFRKADLDIWIVNFWVSLFQFSVGLLYAPLAAFMSGLAIVDIPQNLYRGLLCFVIGKNFVENNETTSQWSQCPPGICEPLTIDNCFPTCSGDITEEFSYCDPVDWWSTGEMDTFSGDVMSLGQSVNCFAEYYVSCDPLIDPYQCVKDQCGLTNITVYGPSSKNTPDCYPYCSPVCASPDQACLNCGTGGDTGTCCDACDGGVACLSQLSALGAVLLYISFNIAYNTFLLLVIKYGSAALMYVASTVVLPLGGVAFTLSFIFGPHASQFTIFNGVGLLIVLLGLICYRFVGRRKKKPQEAPEVVGADIVDVPNTFSVVGQPYEYGLVEQVEVQPRNVRQIRSSYYSSLGINATPPHGPS